MSHRRKEKQAKKVCVAGIVLTEKGMKGERLEIRNPGLMKIAEMNRMSVKELWKAIADDMKTIADEILKEVENE